MLCFCIYYEEYRRICLATVGAMYFRCVASAAHFFIFGGCKMKRTLKRSLSLLLAAVMLFGASPIGALAEIDFPSLRDLFTVEAKAATYSGTCGDDVNWNLNTETKVLTISGTGEMDNYKYAMAAFNDQPWYDYRDSIESVVIETGVTSIGECAFYCFDNIKNISIAQSVVSIGKQAFYACKQIEFINIPGSVEEIKASSFWACEKLTDITIGSGVKTIGSSAFAKTAINSIVIPDSVTSLGSSAFSWCGSLENISIGKGVTVIDESVFSNCVKITKLTIPEHITQINDNAFYGCTGIEELIIPVSTKIENGEAFEECENIKKVTFTKGTGVMQNYSSSSSSKTKTDYKYTPWYISRKTLNTVVFSDDILSIGDYAFYGCSKIKELTLPASAKIYNSEYTFKDCTGIEKITLTKGTGLMQDYATVSGEENTFFGYTPWYVSRESLKELVIESGVARIGDNAFRGCSELLDVYLPRTLKTVRAKAFESCGKLTNVYFEGTQTEWTALTIGTNNEDLTEAIIHYNYQPHIHAYSSSVTKAPTCTETGIRTYTCSCNDSYTQVIPVVDHNLGSWEVLTPATCTQTGEKVKRCTACKNIIERDTIAKTTHNPGDWQITVAATCSQTGIKVKVCTGCSTTLETQTIPKTAHTPSAWQVTTAATCTQTGTKVKVCTTCTETLETLTVPKTEHTLGEWEITVEPTKETVGKKVKRCTVCKNVIEEEVIPKIGATVTIQNYPTTIFYKETAIIRAVGENLPSGAKIKWSVSGGTVELSPSVDSKSCSIKFLKRGDIKITATVDGTTISDTVTVKVKYAWWQWIIIILLFGWIWY